MRPARCTIDSSCIISLDCLDLVPRLSSLFATVLLPRAVRAELFKRPRMKKRIRRLFNDHEFLQRCDGYEDVSLHLLLVQRKLQGTRDRGEAEAVLQAAEFGATVIVDDAWGRAQADEYELESHGTLWVLKSLHEMGILTAPALRDGFLLLRRRGRWLPWEAVNELLTSIGEDPL